MKLIDAIELSKEYPTRNGKRQVLKNISFQVLQGDHFGILGRNGSGKSTLVRLISGIELPSQGVIKRSMSVSWPMAFTGSFQGSLTGLDNLRFIARIYGKDAGEVRPFVEDFAELGNYFLEPVKNYSSGMVARLAFALSLAIDFDCFLIDEVIAVGDARFRQRCHDELFVKRKNHAFIIVSHDPEILKTYCNRGAVLSNGQLETFNTIDEAYEHYTKIG